MAQRTKVIPKPPGFAAIWTATLARPPIARRDWLPSDIYAVRSLRVDPDKAARFDRLVGGTVSDWVHPGYLHTMAFPIALSLMAKPRFPTPLLGLVHVKNSFLQHQGVRVGECLDIECKVQKLQPHRRGRTFEAVSVFSREGEIVATDVSTYLARGNYAAGAEQEQKPAADSRSGPNEDPQPIAGQAEKQQATHPVQAAAVDTESRVPFVPPPPSGRWKLAANTGRAYAAVSADANPIHMSALCAKAFGFPAAIAHGMYTASRAFSESRPERDKPLRWDVEFGAPVVLPATVWLNYTAYDEQGRVEYVGYRAARGEKTAQRHFHGFVKNLS